MNIGRPRTGRKPNSSIRVNLDILHQARIAAVTQKKTLGQWLEEAIVEKVIAENSEAVQDVISGGKKNNKARGFLMGQVMQKTKGQANPKVVSQILATKLK